MNEAQKQLALRLVEHPAWRWMPGMRRVLMRASRDGEEIAGTYSARNCMGIEWPMQDGDPCEVAGYATVIDRGLPDLTDPATVGCLLVLARKAWSDPGLSCVTASYSDGVYLRRIVDGHHHGSTFMAMSQVKHATEGEAIAHAILAAPKETT